MVKNSFYRFWHWAAFLVLLTLCLLPLLKGGLYIFTDSGYYYHNVDSAHEILVSKLGLFSRSDGFYFGYDNSQRSFASLPIAIYQFVLTYIFGSSIGQILFYSLYYLGTFVFALKLLYLLMGEKAVNAVRISALYIAFNPFSILISTLFSVSFSYLTFIIFTYAAIKWLEVGRYRHLALAAVSSVCFINYLRLTPIICILIILLLLIFKEKFKSIFNIKRVIVLGVVVFFTLLPFLVGNVVSLINGSNISTNYQKGFEQYETANYAYKSSFINSLSHNGGFTPSAISFFYNQQGRVGVDDAFSVPDGQQFWKATQIFFNLSIVLVGIILLKNSAYSIRVKLVSIIFSIIVTVSVSALGYFVDKETFIQITKSLLFFLYNDYGFLQFIQVILCGFLIYYIAEAFQYGGRFKSIAFTLLVIVYLVINASPTLFFKEFYGFKKVDNIPAEFSQLVSNENPIGDRQASIFIPYYWVKLSWAPYFLNVNYFNGSKFQTLITPNFRTAPGAFIDFFNSTTNEIDNPNFENVKLYNIKNFVVLNSVETKNNSIDTYGVLNTEANLKSGRDMLDANPVINKTQSNNEFSIYDFKDSDNYDFFIYRPETVATTNSEDFYSNSINISSIPVALEEDVSADVKSDLATSTVTYKYSQSDSNKYYVKISSDNPTSAVPIQFNQMFSRGWQVYSITKQEFDSKECVSGINFYSITKNYSCIYNSTPLNINNLKFLFDSPIDVDHLKGNLYGNLFILSTQPQTENDKYFVIFFKGQLFYQIAIYASAGILFLLLLLSTYQEFLLFRKVKS